METNVKNNLGTVGLIGRFKPLHNGGYAMLEAICEKSQNIKIGIGSSNKYNLRNPFTAEESAKMIELALSPKFSDYEIIQVPDFAHIPEYSNGVKWRDYVLEVFGKLDYFISSNDYVRKLLENSYALIHPGELIEEDKKFKLKGTQVRIEMACFGDWKKLVPDKIAEYLEENRIVERFRKEFGIQTLSLLSREKDFEAEEELTEEKIHTMEA
jgi:nicotinamide-nucleotide adenylyltransferase